MNTLPLEMRCSQVVDNTVAAVRELRRKTLSMISATPPHTGICDHWPSPGVLLRDTSDMPVIFAGCQVKLFEHSRSHPLRGHSSMLLEGKQSLHCASKVVKLLACLALFDTQQNVCFKISYLRLLTSTCSLFYDDFLLSALRSSIPRACRDELLHGVSTSSIRVCCVCGSMTNRSVRTKPEDPNEGALTS